jgi:hypothetical protein
VTSSQSAAWKPSAVFMAVGGKDSQSAWGGQPARP